jgi:hypothetical protein
MLGAIKSLFSGADSPKKEFVPGNIYIPKGRPVFQGEDKKDGSVPDYYMDKDMYLSVEEYAELDKMDVGETLEEIYKNRDEDKRDLTTPFLVGVHSHPSYKKYRIEGISSPPEEIITIPVSDRDHIKLLLDHDGMARKLAVFITITEYIDSLPQVEQEVLDERFRKEFEDIFTRLDG